MYQIPITRYRPTRASDGAGGWNDTLDAGLALFGALTIHDLEIDCFVERLEDVRIDDLIAVADEDAGVQAYYRVVSDHRPPRAHRRRLKLQRVVTPLFPTANRTVHRRRAPGVDRTRIGDGVKLVGQTFRLPETVQLPGNTRHWNVCPTQTGVPPMIEAILAQILAGESELQPVLALYNGSPAIFTSKVPEDAPRPALHLHCEVVRPFDFRERFGFTMQTRIRILGSAEQFNLTALRGLAWQIYLALNRRDLSAPLAAAGYEDHGCRAQAPVDGPQNAPFPECAVVVQVVALKQ